jgi:spore germination protein GerM
VPVDPSTAAVLNVYFPRLFEDGALGLRAVPRTVVTDDRVDRQLLEALLAGPNGEERADSQYPALDRRTRLLRVDQVGDLASIEFDEALRRVIGRPFSELAYWSIVYTATEVSPVERVTLVRSEAPLLSFGAPPVSIGPGATRAQAPAWVRPR